jgi:hypothetical protein
LLPFDKKHRPFGIHGCRFDFVKALSSMNREIAKKMFFSYRTSQAIIKNIKTVRGAHFAAPPYQLECTCALLGVITVTSPCDCEYVLNTQPDRKLCDDGTVVNKNMVGNDLYPYEKMTASAGEIL